SIELDIYSPSPGSSLELIFLNSSDTNESGVTGILKSGLTTVMENHNIIVIISDEINMKLTSFFNPKNKKQMI
ncbi:TPA: hypothetical protein ACG30D_005313, partial [Escherichia coli]